MPTTYTNGLKLPDLGSIDWFNAYKNNIDILDPIVGTVNGVATTYAPISHNHDASEITSGTIDIARLPPAALERLTTVADQTARYALTTSTVQLGDTVKQLDTGIMYLVVDTTKLNSADGYVEYSAGTASKAIADEDGTSIKTGYVNVAGNQTVTGQKTWSGNQFFTSPMYPKNTSYEIGTTPASNVAIPIYFTDKNNVYTGYVRNVILTTGRTQSELYARNKFTSGALSSTGTDVTSTLQVEVQSNGDKTLYFDGSIRNNVLPYATNTYSLGSSSYQWSSVYAQTYYYNGTVWGLDKVNEWSNTNTLSAVSYGEKLRFKNTGLDLSSGNPALSSTYQHIIWWDDKNSKHYAKVQAWTNDTNGTILLASYYRADANTVRNSTLCNQCGATSKSFFPDSNSDTDLGTSTNKWKTLNGINPGALSLPNTPGGAGTVNVNYIDLSGDITIRDASSPNYYTAICDGWISINSFATWIQIADDTTLVCVTGAIGADGFGQCYLPVRKNDSIRIVINQTNTNFQSFKLIPCQGNV